MMMRTTNKAKLTETSHNSCGSKKYSSGAYLRPTRDKQDKANHSLLKNHYQQVEDTLADPGSSLWRVTWENSAFNLRQRTGGDSLTQKLPGA